MATNKEERTTDALPNLRKLLSTNSSQEARSWVDEAQFHSQGFKDSAKFFQTEFFHFNSKVQPEKSKEWTRARLADPTNDVEARAFGLHAMVNADGRPRAETEQQFTDRVKAFNLDRPTHDNLAYALTLKVPQHIARYIKDRANAPKIINVQDICNYIIETYDSTSGVSTQDTWSEQYNKLKNKDRKKTSEFSKFYEEQQRLANIYMKLSTSYPPDVQEYRDTEIRNMTMQLYRHNLPHHLQNSDHPDRFLEIKQLINTTAGKSTFTNYTQLSTAINASYNVWVNDVENQKDSNPEEDNTKRGGMKRKIRDNDDEGKNNYKKKKENCPLHPKGRHTSEECRDLKLLNESKNKNNNAGKSNERYEQKSSFRNEKKTAFKNNEVKKTRFETNSITFAGCSNCKEAGRPFRSHNGFNCFYGAEKQCKECHIVDNHLATCSQVQIEKIDLDSIFALPEINVSNTIIAKNAPSEVSMIENFNDLMDLFDENAIETLPTKISNENKISPMIIGEEELLDWDPEEFEISNKDKSSYFTCTKIVTKMTKVSFDENVEKFPFIKRKTIFGSNMIKLKTIKENNRNTSYTKIGIIDTGCENHMTPNSELIIPNSYEDLSHTDSKVVAAEGSETKIIGKGTMKIKLENGKDILFPNTLVVPHLRQTLISPQQILERYNCIAKFDLQIFELCGKTSITIGYYNNRNWIIRNYNKINAENVSITKIPITQTQYEHLHVTLGHPGDAILNKLLTKGLIITGIKEYDEYVENMKNHEDETVEEPLKINCSQIKLRRCLICDSSKAKKHPFYQSNHKVTTVNEKIGTDLTGPIRTEGFRKEKYIMILIDYFTKFIELHCLLTKDTWPATLITALKKRVNKHDKKIKTIRTDNAEMQSNTSIAWLNDEGIQAEYIPPGGDHSEMGGGYERYFQTLSTMITASLLQANLPPKFWSLSATHNSKLKNMWYNNDMETSPYIAEENKKPNISQYHPFGCFAIYKNNNDNKILPDGDPGIYIGNKATNIYLIYNIKTKKLDQSSHVRFYDHFFPGIKTSNITDLDKLLKNDTSELSENDKLDILKLFDSNQNVILSNNPEEDESPSERFSLRQKEILMKGKNNFTKEKIVEKGENVITTDKVTNDDDFEVILYPYSDDEDNEETLISNDSKNIVYSSNTFPKSDIPLLDQKILITDMAPLPKSMKEAMNRPDANRWKIANEKEKDAIINKWKVGIPIGKEDISKDEHIIPTKLVFAYKDHEGLLKDYKVRIVGRGDLMRKDEYEDTFSPVVRIKTQRILIALSVAKNLFVKQFDCENAYLQGKTRRRILIRLPEGWELKTPKGEETRVAIADKALYGLKESGRDWYITLKEDLLKDNYNQLEADPCVFIKKLDNTELNIISIYVDDGLQICKNESLMDKEFERFTTRFKAREYRESDYILSISTERVKDGIILHQSAYAKTILEEFGIWEEPKLGQINGTKPTPMAVNYKYDELIKRLDKKMNSQYRSIIMKLSYLAQQTRADIMFAVNVLAQYQEKPTENEWRAMIHILKYLKGTWDFGLFYRKTQNNENLSIITNAQIFPSSAEPECFADASFANEENRKSRSGYLFFMSGAIVTWCSKKQPVISVSSTEAELYALSEAVREGIWIRRLLKELNEPLLSSTIVNQDNKSTIAIAKNPIHHQRTKHIDVKMNQLRQYLDSKDLVLKWCPTEDMIADILTKALPSSQHKRFTKLMGYVSVSDLRKRST